MTVTTETRRLALPDRYDFAATVGQLPMGGYDPCLRVATGSFWWATRTPDGAATLQLRRDGGSLEATGYGPGRDWVLEQADGVAGLRDDTSSFGEVSRRHPIVQELARRNVGFRLPALGRTFPRLLRAIFEQKVTGKEAYRAYAATVRHFHADTGREPAPGPMPLLLPPDPAAVAATPYWVFHRFGVEQRRADTLCRAAAVADALEACPDAATATARLTAVPGIGAWTTAEVARVVYGDPDAVSVGDYHIPHLVSWNLAGQARARVDGRSASSRARVDGRSASSRARVDGRSASSRAEAWEGAPGRLSPADERMLELLEPFRGHRGRVCVLLERSGEGAPRFGPRMPIRSFAAY